MKCMLLTRCQFHQCFTGLFRTKFLRQNFKPKASFVVFGTKILFEKHTCKMLMKLTLGYRIQLKQSNENAKSTSDHKKSPSSKKCTF